MIQNFLEYKYACMPVCKYASMQICKYASITPDPLPIKVALTNIWTSPAWLVYGIATMQVGKYASRQIYKCVNVKV